MPFLFFRPCVSFSSKPPLSAVLLFPDIWNALSLDYPEPGSPPPYPSPPPFSARVRVPYAPSLPEQFRTSGIAFSRPLYQSLLEKGRKRPTSSSKPFPLPLATSGPSFPFRPVTMLLRADATRCVQQYTVKSFPLSPLFWGPFPFPSKDLSTSFRLLHFFSRRTTPLLTGPFLTFFPARFFFPLSLFRPPMSPEFKHPLNDHSSSNFFPFPFCGCA